MKQQTKEWHKLRKSKIGGSDAPIIMNVSPWKTPLDLFLDKTSTIPLESTNCFWMQRGLDLEPQSLELFENLTGYLMTPRVMFHPTIGYMMASLDGMDLDGKAIVEIKCPGKVDHECALDGEVPEKYIPQLQHQMITTGLHKVYYFSYAITSYKILEVHFDEEYSKKLLQKEADFWDCVQRNVEPEIIKTHIEMNSKEWTNAADEWRDLQVKIKQLEQQQKEVKNRLLAMCNGQQAKGSDLTVSKTIKRGNVDYSKIPVLNGIDLELYRKESREEWRIT